jgi:hypothetical protein
MTASASESATTAPDQRSLAEIVGDVAGDLSTLVRQEMELARAELKQEAAKAGKGAGMLGGAGLAGLLALFFGSLAAVHLLDNWLDAEGAAALVALIWLVLAGVLAMSGRKQFQQTNPELPKTQQSLKENVK